MRWSTLVGPAASGTELHDGPVEELPSQWSASSSSRAGQRWRHGREWAPASPGLGRAWRDVPVAFNERRGTLDAQAKELRESIEKGEGAIWRAEHSMSEAALLHQRLNNLRATRIAGSTADEVADLLKGLPKMEEAAKGVGVKALDMATAAEAQRRARPPEESDVGGRWLDFAKQLVATRRLVDHTLSDLGIIVRRAWELVDLYKSATIVPSLESTMSFASDPGVKINKGRTASGCVCDSESSCDFHDRDFTWCVIEKAGEDCVLREDTSERDAVGADHRVSGSGVPPRLWDYCVAKEEEVETPPNESSGLLTLPSISEISETPKPKPKPETDIAVHRNCKCADRMDLVDKYTDDPRYQDKDGKLDWKQVPRADRFAIEAMVMHNVQDTGDENVPSPLCVRTVSSGSQHICPAEMDKPGDSGWCGSHGWDFCVPSEDSKAMERVSTGTLEELDTAALIREKEAKKKLELELATKKKKEKRVDTQDMSGLLPFSVLLPPSAVTQAQQCRRRSGSLPRGVRARRRPRGFGARFL